MHAHSEVYVHRRTPRSFLLLCTGRDNDQAPLPGQAAPRGAAGAAAGAAAGTGASSGSANARGPQGAPSSMEEEDSDGDEGAVYVQQLVLHILCLFSFVSSLVNLIICVCF